MSSAALKIMAFATCLLSHGCMSIDGFLYNGAPVDAYEWDADPPDPDLEGAFTPLHPSTIGPRWRIEGLLEVEGRDLHYVYAHRPDALATIFYSHGNYRNLGHYWERVELMWSLGYNVLIYDYPGYGLSTGEPDEASVYANAAAALAELTTLPGYDPDALIFFGFSLGAAPTFELAARGVRGEGPRPRAVISEAAFCSVEALVQDGTFLGLSAAFLSEHRFDNCAKIAALEGTPTMILHGEDETFIVPRHAEMLAERASGPLTLHMIPGATHSDLPAVAGVDYREWIAAFIAASLE
jgi:fermentation-respiration switch protein FrsA (DUF1100 family)